jgi:hypothetical protein
MPAVYNVVVASGRGQQVDAVVETSTSCVGAVVGTRIMSFLSCPTCIPNFSKLQLSHAKMNCEANAILLVLIASRIGNREQIISIHIYVV